MPERLAYDEAMQFSSIRLKMPVPELKQGKVEMVSIPTSRGILERPWGIEGGFAVVYKFRRSNGTVCALRCFRVPMSPDTQFRYEHIGSYFHAHVRAITAGFRYYDAAIVVKEQGKPPDQRYPVIEMDWIDGVTLVDKVNELCKKRNRPALKALAEEWLSILRIMQQAHIAHGDLSGVNIMVDAGNKLVLIDYDGVYIPEFAGLPQTVIGQEDFQHPQMAQRQFNEHMDAFSALVIYCSLLAVTSKPELWDTYSKFGPDGKLQDVNMLFRQSDFRDPQQSPLFHALEHLGDTHLTRMIQELKRACLQPINQVQFPFALIDPDYQQKQAFVLLEHALKTDNDEQIASAWLPLLERYQPAQPYRSRVLLAQQRVSALQAFRQAITTGDLQRILNSYNAQLLDTSSSITSQERNLLSLARSFLQAYQNNTDDLLTIADRLRNSLTSVYIVFTPQQQQHLTRISQRKLAHETMQKAFNSKNIEQIASIYPLLHLLKALTPEEQQTIKLAADFINLFTSTNSARDDQAFLVSYDALYQEPYTRFFTFTPQQEQRASSIRKRITALENFRLALATRSPWRLVKAYDPIWDAHLTPTERELLALARPLTEALRTNDDLQLLAINTTLQQSSSHAFFLLTDEEKQRISLAKQRQDALLKFRTALLSKDPHAIVTAYPASLDTGTALLPAERDLLAHARMFVQAFTLDEDETFLATLNALQQSGLEQFFLITSEEQRRFILAQQRIQAIQSFRNALSSTPTDAQSLLDAYDASLLDASSVVTAEEREIVDAALRYLAMCEAVRAGIQITNDDERDEAIRKTYDSTLAQRFTNITPAEQACIELAMLLPKVEDLLKKGEYEQIFILADTIQRTTGQQINGQLVMKLKRATMGFIRRQDLKHLRVQVEDRGNINYAVVTWQWPISAFIQIALLTWRFELQPLHPSKVKDWQDPEWHYHEVRRKDNAHEGRVEFPVGRGTRLYIRGYAALLDTWEREPDTQEPKRVWRFSSGDEPTASAEATSPQIIWRNA
jgi:serine/threonine protein kinase